MVVSRALVLLLALALAGCSNPDPGPAAEGAGEPGGADGLPAQEADTPSAAPDPATSPAPSPAPPPAATPAAASQPSSKPVVGTCDLSAAAGAGAAGSNFSGTGVVLCRPVRLSSASGGPFRSAVVEMEWSNGSPTLAEVSLEVSDESGVLGVGASAQSPVRVELAAGAFEPSAKIEWSAMFDGSGVFADFQATVTFSLFESDAPPAGYTALA